MNPERLLAHFDRISEAPDAVPRLRRFILDLAVRGKLVEQDPKDEPAAELLTRIQARHIESRKAGKLKEFQTRGLPPFSTPAGWEWGRFDEIAVVESNLVNPRDYPTSPHIAPDNIEAHTGRLLPYETIKASGVFSSKHSFSAGCILYSKIRPALAKAVIADFDGLCSADMYPIRPFLNRAFLHRYMLSGAFVEQATSEDNRLAMPKTNRASLAKVLVPVPPLAEQQRIVTRVDELMALCDQLEASQAEREQRRDRVTVGSLHRLDEPADDAAEFRGHAEFHLHHLPRLATRPEHVQRLRQTILNLAVRGRLVAQDPREQPGSELLTQIQMEKDRLVKEGKLRREAPFKPIGADEMPFEAPPGWAWVPFGAAIISRDGERVPVSKEERSVRAKKYDYYGASGVIDKIDGYLFDKPLLLIGEDGANLINRSTPIAFIARGKYWVNNHAHVLDGISDGFLRYLEIHINAIDLKPYVTGTAQPKMNQAKMNSIPIALAPLAEQHRIVVKVNELMAVCDQLEAQLTATQTESRRLLEAVLHEALATAA